MRILREIRVSSLAAGLLWAALACPPAVASEGGATAEAAPAPPGEAGGPGLALRARKILTASRAAPGFVDNGTLLVRDGRVEAVGPTAEIEVPEGYQVIDVGQSWLMPGLVDAHTHSGSRGDYNDMVFQTNPGLRISAAITPGWTNLHRAMAGGVTTVLSIPGSGTNVGGQGILMKTGPGTFEEMQVRSPGSFKLSQGDNPTRWGYGMGRSMMNFHLRSLLRCGRAYWQGWRDFEESGGPEPERRIHHDVFRDLHEGRTQISVHTQYYQLVLTTITMLKGEFGLPTYIDHGTFDGYRTAELAQELGVAAIIGPRQISIDSRRFPNDISGSIVGCAGEYQARGHQLVGFNTDAPVVASEELSVQSAMGVRYGFDNSQMDAVRGVTIVPAIVAGIDERVGSLEPGKDADILVLDGDPADARTAVRTVYLEGRRVYEFGEAPGW